MTNPITNHVDQRHTDNGASFQTGTLRDASDTLDLRYGIWKKNQNPKRWLVFLNGRTEWIEKYAYLAPDLDLPEDCGFLTWDHRGQGASGGTRAYVDHYEQFAQDAAIIVNHIVGKKPYSILSHSMGGLISLYAVMNGYLNPKALALSSPLLLLPNKPVPRSLARPVSALLSYLLLSKLNSGVGYHTKAAFAANALTHDINLFERMRQTPYPVPSPTYGWVAATFKATQTIFDPKTLSRLKAPVLIMGGTGESVVDPGGFREWVNLANEHSQGEVQLRLISDAKHELFSEIQPYYTTAISTVRSWLLPHLKQGD